jgi:hypothetical protein
MTSAPSNDPDRNAGDEAEARAWARIARRRAEAGLVRDDSDFLERKLEEERRRLAARDLGDRV